MCGVVKKEKEDPGQVECNGCPGWCVEWLRRRKRTQHKSNVTVVLGARGSSKNSKIFSAFFCPHYTCSMATQTLDRSVLRFGPLLTLECNDMRYADTRIRISSPTKLQMCLSALPVIATTPTQSTHVPLASNGRRSGPLAIPLTERIRTRRWRYFRNRLEPHVSGSGGPL